MFKVQALTRAQAEGPGWEFGFGGAVLIDPKAAGTPQAPGTLQWNGAYGHKWFIDPANALTVVALTNTAFEGMIGPLHRRCPQCRLRSLTQPERSRINLHAFHIPQLDRPLSPRLTLQALRTRVNGRVFVPGDAGYDTARQTWNATTFDQRPAIVLMPTSAADVVSAVELRA